MSAPSLTEKDVSDLTFGVEHGIDFVALSFVRTAEDVKRILREDCCTKKQRRYRSSQKSRSRRVGKNLDAIAWRVLWSHGFARGDLGVEMALEKGCA